MKKLGLLTILFLITLTLDVKALSCNKKYSVKTVSSTSLSEDIGCTDDYEEAKALMREYPSTVTNVAAIYRGKELINARYAVVNLAGKDGLTNMYNNKEFNGFRYTYFDGNWGSDAAFIDFYPDKNTVQIKLSGAVGWVVSTRADITPISNLYANTITAKRAIRVRTNPKIESSNQISTIQAGSVWNFFEKVEADGYLWYKIDFNGSYAYVAGKNLSNNDVYATEASTYSFKTYYSVNSSNNLVHYYRVKTSSQISISLGKAPSYLKQGVKYYSFDGNYFYLSLETMLDDYYNGNYANAVNAETPYFNYYMYLPTHNLSGYTADDLNQIIKNKGYNRSPDPNTVYYTLEGGWTSAPRSGVSVMYGSGEDFIRVQEEYGVNALLMFGTAINESATGTSAIAFLKNNLFGIGAVDSSPITSARSYDTVYDTIVAHAKLTGTSYATPTNTYFYGSFYGNKGSGFGVNYASDPYWGEKTARLAYQNDQLYGGQDYNSNTLGIKLTSEAIAIKKRPSDSSDTIYLLKNNKNNHLVANMSYIVTEKVLGDDGTYWYKVYADSSLDKNQNLASTNYNFNYSYGYIKAEYLYVSNSETLINADSKSIYRGEEIDLMKDITAIDPEDGDLTSGLTYTGEVDVNTVGEYKITYSVTDNSRYTTRKEIIITVLPSEAPIIEANDLEVKQYTLFEPEKHVRVYDTYGNPMNDYEVLVNEVDTSQVGTYEVVYKATYENLNITKKINVRVIKDEEPTLNVSNRTIKLNEQFNYMSGVSASDIEDGDITSKVTYEGTVDTTTLGEYELTYIVVDSANQSVSKKVKITVEEIEYVKKDGDFYFNELSFSDSLLNLSGYLAIKGTNNTKEDNITYDLIFRNNDTQEDTIMPLERYIENAPTRHYSDSKYDYSATWFKGSISLSSLAHGEYTLYVRARKDNMETISLFRNLLLKDMVTKVEDGTRGYLFRNNTYLDEYPIELFVFDNGLISNVVNNNYINMINSYKTIEIKESKMTIKGTSYNIGTSYATKDSVMRNIIFENVQTKERFTFDIGSIVGLDIPLNVNDGFTRERGWFNSTVDIKSLPVGDYIIYIQTISGNTNDFGELNDIFLKDLSGITGTFDSKKVTFTLNQNKRFRIEMHIEAL